MAVKRKLIIFDKIKEIEYSLNLVQENMPQGLEQFKSLGLLKDGIMKRTEFMIQNIIDICAVLSSDLKLEKPNSEDDIIDNMGRAGILSHNLVSKIHDMKGMRNVLVHRYGKIDDGLVYESLTGDLDDIDIFVNRIREFLDGN